MSDILLKRLMKRAFHELYFKARHEQSLKDSRICSSKMREVEELKEWYFQDLARSIKI